MPIPSPPHIPRVVSSESSDSGTAGLPVHTTIELSPSTEMPTDPVNEQVACPITLSELVHIVSKVVAGFQRPAEEIEETRKPLDENTKKHIRTVFYRVLEKSKMSPAEHLEWEDSFSRPGPPRVLPTYVSASTYSSNDEVTALFYGGPFEAAGAAWRGMRKPEGEIDAMRTRAPRYQRLGSHTAVRGSDLSMIASRQGLRWEDLFYSRYTSSDESGNEGQSATKRSNHRARWVSELRDMVL
ncbi:hypothetical protein RhiJN_25004 [Ceratobasidium sp. AG-Ba]|nr:hypothetical protein RhiJN_25004 [Ceratobasidium sp. AG-Ba]